MTSYFGKKAHPVNKSTSFLIKNKNKTIFLLSGIHSNLSLKKLHDSFKIQNFLS